MPTWTTPLSPLAGRVISVADWNTYISGNDAYLLNRPGQRIIRNNGADYTTTSTTFVDIDGTNLAITLVMSGSAALLSFSGIAIGSTTQFTYFDFVIDGVRYSAAPNGCWGGYTNGAASQDVNMPNTVLVTGLSAASHTFKVQWRTTAGTATLHATVGSNNVVCFSAQEVA